VAEAWGDTNENGKWDEGEPPLPGAKLKISVWGFDPCANNYFRVDSCSPKGVDVPRGVDDSDLWLLVYDRCYWHNGLAAATDSQGRMIIAIETDTALGYAFTPVAPVGYRAPLQPSSGIRYGYIPMAPDQPEDILTPAPQPTSSGSASP
jgi:hypothetical protein